MIMNKCLACAEKKIAVLNHRFQLLLVFKTVWKICNLVHSTSEPHEYNVFSLLLLPKSLTSSKVALMIFH